MIEQYSGISRSLDPRYRSNVLIVAFSAAVFLLALAVNWGRGIEPIEAGVRAFWVAGSAFLAWILAREIDPDTVETSGLAAILGAVAALAFNAEVAIVPLAVAVVAVRVINRITGAAPTLWDNLFLLVLVVWSAMDQFWLMGIVAAFAYGFDQLLEKPYALAQAWAGVMTLATLLTALAFKSFSWAGSLEWALIPPLLLVLVWHSWLVGQMPLQLRSTEDRSEKRLNRQRILAGQTLLLVALILLGLWRGWAGVEGLVALWAAEFAFLLRQTSLILRS